MSACVLPTKVHWQDLCLWQRRESALSTWMHLPLLEGELRGEEKQLLASFLFQCAFSFMLRAVWLFYKGNNFIWNGIRMCCRLSDWKAVSRIGVSYVLHGRSDNCGATGQGWFFTGIQALLLSGWDGNLEHVSLNRCYEVAPSSSLPNTQGDILALPGQLWKMSGYCLFL